MNVTLITKRSLLKLVIGIISIICLNFPVFATLQFNFTNRSANPVQLLSASIVTKPSDCTTISRASHDLVSGGSVTLSVDVKNCSWIGMGYSIYKPDGTSFLNGFFAIISKDSSSAHFSFACYSDSESGPRTGILASEASELTMLYFDSDSGHSTTCPSNFNSIAKTK